MKKKPQKLDRMAEMMRDLKADFDNGFRFVIYVGTWRRRRYISEISGVKRTGSSIGGFSWQAPNRRQSEMRWYERCLTLAKIPIEYKHV